MVIRALRVLLDKSSENQFQIFQWFGKSVYNSVKNNDEEILDMLLSAGGDVNIVPHGTTALQAAIEKQNKSMVKKLVDAGSVLNSKVSWCSGRDCGGFIKHQTYKNALVSPVEWGDKSVIECLLGAGASVDTLGKTRSGCMTALAVAIKAGNSDLANYLIDHGASVNNPGYYKGNTPFSAAISLGNLQLANLLILRGANPYDDNALVVAAYNLTKLQFLLGKCHDYNGSSENRYVGTYMCFGDCFHTDSWASNETLLMIATKINVNIEILEPLLQHQAKPNGVCINGCTPLQSATWRGRKDEVEILLRYGANPNVAGIEDGSQTPLQLASTNSNNDIVGLLLKWGGDVNAVTKYYPHTLLQRASRDGNKDMVELLLRYGADVNASPAPKFGATALQFAAIGGFLGIVYLLLEAGADVNAPPAEHDGRTALEGAAEHGRIDTVQFLLNAGADIFNGTQYELALKRAAENGHHSIVRLLKSSHS
ncbi:ankyrin repeat-containing domain protein [Xylogone sp. PMI_703]|nr:ankyrin repeat-containing domain protein [Xylogone sp. PMI_703]